MAPVLFSAEQTHCSTLQNKAVSSGISYRCTHFSKNKENN